MVSVGPLNSAGGVAVLVPLNSVDVEVVVVVVEVVNVMFGELVEIVKVPAELLNNAGLK